MSDFHIYIGYRTISSWSMRGWLPLKKTGAAFDETLIRYRIPAEKKRLAELSPTARVPLLDHQRDGKSGQKRDRRTDKTPDGMSSFHDLILR